MFSVLTPFPTHTHTPFLDARSPTEMLAYGTCIYVLRLESKGCTRPEPLKPYPTVIRIQKSSRAVGLWGFESLPPKKPSFYPCGAAAVLVARAHSPRSPSPIGQWPMSPPPKVKAW